MTFLLDSLGLRVALGISDAKMSHASRILLPKSSPDTKSQRAYEICGLADHVQAANLPSAAQVVSWMDLVDLCRELDEALVSAEPPSEDAIALHEAVVKLAIA